MFSCSLCDCGGSFVVSVSCVLLLRSWVPCLVLCSVSLLSALLSLPDYHRHITPTTNHPSMLPPTNQKTLSLVDLGLKSAFVIIRCFVSSYKISTPLHICFACFFVTFPARFLHVSTSLTLIYYSSPFPWTVMSSLKYLPVQMSQRVRRP